MSRNDSWIEIHCLIPFRSKYLYWDKKPYNFQNKNVKVRTIEEFDHLTYPYRAFVISCWKKDSTKVEEAMDDLDRYLKIIDKNYEMFLKIWRQGLLKMRRR